MTKPMLAIGPFHPLQEEMEFYQLTIDGETVTDIEVRLSYNHRGMEEIAETLQFDQIPFLVSRICGICSASHPLAYVQAVEELGEEGRKVERWLGDQRHVEGQPVDRLEPRLEIVATAGFVACPLAEDFKGRAFVTTEEFSHIQYVSPKPWQPCHRVPGKSRLAEKVSDGVDERSKGYIRGERFAVCSTIRGNLLSTTRNPPSDFGQSLCCGHRN